MTATGAQIVTLRPNATEALPENGEWHIRNAGALGNCELATLSHLINKAVDWGWIAHRPTQIKRLKEAQGRITYLPIEESAKLIEAAKLATVPVSSGSVVNVQSITMDE